MRRVLRAWLTAMVLAALAAALDWFGFAEGFGLWTYTLGTISGIGLALLGLLISIWVMIFSRRKSPGLALGAQVILTGLFTFALVLLIWLATGKPAPTIVLF